MKKLLILLIIFSAVTSAQNLVYDSGTVSSGDSIITIDLGADLNRLQQDYAGGNELRLIAVVFTGTWTNTSFTVSASNAANGTYYDVYDADGTQLTITMASNRWIWLEPIKFAGLRYLKLTGATAEGGTRTYWIVERIY